MSEPLLEARDVAVELAGTRILHGVGLTVEPGQVVALLGPNGAGKSTLLAASCGDVPTTSGEIRLGGRPLASWSTLELARRRAVLLQQVTVAFPFTAAQVVAMGRAPWVGTPAQDDDERAVAEALDACDVADLADRQFTTLSGGERARVALARVLAQGTDLLMLDEPTAALDLHHQELVLARARRHAGSGGGVVVVLHDLTLAAAWADRVVVLAGGRVAVEGTPREVLTAETLSAVYGCAVEVLDHPRTGAPIILPVRPG